MDTKLTLKLDQEVIEQAKVYARQKHQSLSVLVEQYFRFLVERDIELEQSDISPTVQQLSGILDSAETDTMRDDYTDYLERKYSSRHPSSLMPISCWMCSRNGSPFIPHRPGC